jgi:hypothetical protein
MSIRTTHDTMTLEIDNRILVAVRFSGHAPADGNGAWIVSACPARLFDRGHAIAALAAAAWVRRQRSPRDFAPCRAVMTRRLIKAHKCSRRRATAGITETGGSIGSVPSSSQRFLS